MADNTLLTPDVIAKEALMQLENNLVFGSLVHRDYEAEFGETKVGETVSIRRPVKYLVREGAVAAVQDTQEGKVPIKVDKQRGVDIEFSSRDLTLSIERFSERYVKPAMIQLANHVDMDVAGLYKDVWNWVGTPGQVIDAYADLTPAPQRLDEMAVPTPRVAALSPADHWGLANVIAQHPSISETAKTALQRAKLPMLGGLDMYSTQNVVTHTAGTRTNTTPLVDGANQNVTYATSKDTNQQNLILKGAGNAVTYKYGDVFTIAGVKAVNPVSKAVMSYDQQFVVKEDATTAAGGGVTLKISPAIIVSGPYQTVSAAPADNAAITNLGTASTGYPQNLVFHKSAFALAMVPMELPLGANYKARQSANGFSVRVISVYDGVNDTNMWRFDVLFGTKAIYPDLATRVSGKA